MNFTGSYTETEPEFLGLPRCKNLPGRTCELFLCFVVVRVRVYCVDCFLCFTSLVSFTGSKTEAEPKFYALARVVYGSFLR